jgi:hypothetical protein
LVVWLYMCQDGVAGRRGLLVDEGRAAVSRPSGASTRLSTTLVTAFGTARAGGSSGGGRDRCAQTVAAQGDVLEHVPGALRALGRLERLSERARDMRAWLERSPRRAVCLEGALARYFRERLGIAPPLDLAEYAAAVGFDSAEAFLQAVQRELAFTERS